MTKKPKESEKASSPAKVLLPLDGSGCSERALAHLVEIFRQQGPMEVHVVNVQLPIDSGHARMFATEAEIDSYHRDEGMKVLKPALERLDTEGIPYSYHVLVGSVAPTIVRFAKEQEFDRIIMGSHGRTGLTQLLMGSVAQNVTRRLKIPVALVK